MEPSALTDAAPTAAPARRRPDPDWHDVACVAHVHSTWSDGTATVPEIAGAAIEAGVPVVLLTDHDTVEAKRRGQEGWHGDALIVVGHEVSPHEGHLLVFGTEREIGHDGLSEPEIIAAAEAAGGIAFAAHPFSRGSRMGRVVGRAHRWSTLEDGPPVGVELWSLLTDTGERWRTPYGMAKFVARPEDGFDTPPEEHLRVWDELGRRHRVPAIGGLDQHQNGVRVFGRVVSPVPNARYFKLLQTHVMLDAPLSGDGGRDVSAVVGALGEGRAYLAVGAVAPGGGFSLWATGEDDGHVVPMGAEAPAGDGWTLHARLPRPARVRVLHDGVPVLEQTTDRVELPARLPGVWRVEARLEHRGRERLWLLSNPVYLR
jgi:hypothetical protein